MATPATASDRQGAGSAMTAVSGGSRASRSLSRRQPCRAPTNTRHWPITTSIGASARADRMEPAMMIPAVASWWITSQAPTASTADCSIMRKARVSPPRPPVTSAARC